MKAYVIFANKKVILRKGGKKLGFLSSLFGSFEKSKKLRKLQMELFPPGKSLDEFTRDLMNDLWAEGPTRREQALEEFFDLCEADEGVANVMSEYNLTREDLNNIYRQLNEAGLGQWIEGHFATLSTLAYFDPFLYTVESERQGKQWQEIAIDLIGYWSGSIRQGELLKQLEM